MRGSGWGTPTLVEHNDVGNANRPQIAMQANGDALVVWHMQDGDLSSARPFFVWSARYVAGTGWEAPQMLQRTSGSAGAPSISMAPDGSAIASWYEWDGSFDIRAARYVPGTGWEAPTMIDDGPEPPFGNPPNDTRVRMDRDGNALLTWSADARLNAADGSGIWAARYVAGIGWQTVEAVQADAGCCGASTPDLAFDDAGNAMAVWYASDATSGGFDVWAARYQRNGGWQTPTRIETTDDNGWFSRVVSDGAGRMTVVWQQQPSSGPNTVWSRRFVPATGWAAAELLSTGPAGVPSLAVDDAGNLLAGWTQFDGTRLTAHAARRPAGGGWEAPRPIEPSQLYDSETVEVALDADGNGLAVWSKLPRPDDDLDIPPPVADLWAAEFR